MKVIAQRGACKESPENSWSAITKAIDAGVNGIKTEVQVTRDNIPILLKSRSLHETTGHKLFVDQTNHEKIQTISLKNGEPIPILKDVLDRFITEVEFYLDVSEMNLETASRFISCLEPFKKHWHNLTIASTNPITLAHINHSESRLTTAAQWEGSFLWPHFSLSNPNLFMQYIQGKTLILPLKLLNKDTVDLAKTHKWAVFPYASKIEENENRTAIWSWIKTLKVDGILTNYPRQLIEWLNEESDYERKYSENRKNMANRHNTSRRWHPD